MSYWQFHLVFLLPALVALLGWQYGRCHLAPPRVWLAIVTTAVIAFVYTTPWDNYLVWRGIWAYRPERVALSWRLGYVPLEEYLFFILQSFLTGLCLWSFYSASSRRQQRARLPHRRQYSRLAGASAAGLSGVLGVLALMTGGKWLYVGLILAWGAPPLVLHWLYRGETLWDWRVPGLLATGLSTAYLWVADRVAIGAGIWHISPLHSTGWAVFGLPVEEALFFLVTNLLIVQTLLLLWQRAGIPRADGPFHP